jgi:two-component system, OmpR family, sensor histidine kinase KdpD
MAASHPVGSRPSAEPGRPDPAKLLAKLQVEDKRVNHSRAVLRVYIGAAAGVGKTYAMLNEGRLRHDRGTDVVIGWVQTYNRPLTVAAAEGLERVAPKACAAGGADCQEMDVDAIIQRQPAVVLVDELAHLNAPGSKHEHRWEDVEELLQADITVITTVNIQHLESLVDRVAQITGSHVPDTVPDWVIDQADDVELIDMAPEALRARMRHGNVWPPERAQRDLDDCCRPEILAALRELALRCTAKEVDDQLATYMRDHNLAGWQVDERVLVCIDHRPSSQTLLRRAAQMGRRLKCPALAVYVQRARLSGADRRALAANLLLAKELDIDVQELSGEHAPESIARFATEQRVTQLIVGHSKRSRWHELLHGSFVQDLLRRLPDVDVRIVGDEAAGGV